LTQPFTVTGKTNPSSPYPVPWTNWVTVNLTAQKISTAAPFVVAFAYSGVGQTDQRLMVVKTPISDGVNSYTYYNEASSGEPAWYYLTAATDSVWTYLVRAYVSFPASGPYPTTYSVAKQINYSSQSTPSGHSASEYRLVGLPGNPGIAVNSILSGKSETDWRVSWDNGAGQNYIQRFDGSSAFTFSTGRAFWILNNGPLSINTTVPTAALNSSRQAEIPLHSGWNLITNPFDGSIQWSLVQADNGISEVIYSYAGTYGQSASFDPYVGYYYYNTANASVLKVSYASLFGRRTESQSDPAAWRVRLSVNDGDFTDSTVSLGVMRDPRDNPTSVNQHAPRSVEGGLQASFARPDLDPVYPAFAADLRQSIGSIQRWPLEVNSRQGKEVSLTFRGVSMVPAGSAVRLIDLQTMRSVNLRADSAYRFTSIVPVSKLTVLIGDPKKVDEDASAVLPSSFALLPNFPNPFNPSTAIAVDLPKESMVSLKVYDVLGNEVESLHDGQLEAGRHWFVWSGRNERGLNVSSGVYLARMQAGSQTFTRKMLLMK
jgi:hypothetical protein